MVSITFSHIIHCASSQKAGSLERSCQRVWLYFCLHTSSSPSCSCSGDLFSSFLGRFHSVTCQTIQFVEVLPRACPIHFLLCQFLFLIHTSSRQRDPCSLSSTGPALLTRLSHQMFFVFSRGRC